MTVTTVPDPTAPSSTDLGVRTIQRSRRFRNGLATVLICTTVVITVVPLLLIFGYVLKRGLEVISLDFFTKPVPIVSRLPGPGMGPAVVGTILITGAAALMAIPLGVMAAIYLSEYGRGRPLTAVLRFLSDVMSGVPSIVMGLFIYTVWVLTFGQSGFAGALALAALMLPIVIRSSESMLRLVPQDLREAAYALGTRRSRTILTVVLPAALPGVVSGCLLAVARAAGETAPLLFCVGAAREFNTDLLHGANTALSVQIFRNAQLPFVGPQQRAWGAALTLIVLVLVLTILARWVSSRFAVR
ncbi:MAG TPA: phosphate ABC transporter permease PstA [Acidimicrobiales bacterium]|nr:phosphate ABC transporter permease PstA [Acidimicrobiales bacterium]